MVFSPVGDLKPNKNLFIYDSRADTVQHVDSEVPCAYTYDDPLESEPVKTPTSLGACTEPLLQLFHIDLPSLEQLLAADKLQEDIAGNIAEHMTCVHDDAKRSRVDQRWTDTYCFGNGISPAIYCQHPSSCRPSLANTPTEFDCGTAQMAATSVHGKQWLPRSLMGLSQCEQLQQQQGACNSQHRDSEPVSEIRATQACWSHPWQPSCVPVSLEVGLAANPAAATVPTSSFLHLAAAGISTEHQMPGSVLNVTQSSFMQPIITSETNQPTTVPLDYPSGVFLLEHSVALDLHKPLVHAAASVGSSSGYHVHLLSGSGIAARHHPQQVAVTAAAAAAAATGGGIVTKQQDKHNPSMAGVIERLTSVGSINSSSVSGTGSLSYPAEAGHITATATGNSNHGLCFGCIALRNQADELVIRCASVSKVPTADKSVVMTLLFRAAACPQQCLISSQLPSDCASSQNWWISYAKARQAQQGRQRAGAGTALGRNFNYNCNAPCPVRQLLQAGPAAGTGVETHPQYFTINSSDHRTLMTAIAVASQTEPIDVGPHAAHTESSVTTIHHCQTEDYHGVGSSSSSSNDTRWSSLWRSRAITCSKKHNEYKGKVFDLFSYAFFFRKQQPDAASLTGTKRKAAYISVRCMV